MLPPFLTWAGSKRILAKKLVPYLPADIDTYYEPFLGGGAFFFAYGYKAQRAILSDTNPDLINAYQQLRDRPVAFVARMWYHCRSHFKYGRYYFQEVLNNLNSNIYSSPLDRASAFVYLARSSRINCTILKSGAIRFLYNPYCPINPDDFYLHSEALANATIRCVDFRQAIPCGRSDDFLFCDPPYTPTIDDKLHRYSTIEWNDRDHLEFFNFFSQTAQTVFCSYTTLGYNSSDYELYASTGLTIGSHYALRSRNFRNPRRSRELIISNRSLPDYFMGSPDPYREIIVSAGRSRIAKTQHFTRPIARPADL